MSVQDFTGEDLDSKPWFKGNMGRTDAERFVMADGEVGAFVVRNSSKAGNYALTYINKKGKLTHSLVDHTDEGFALPDDRRGRVFPTMGALLRTCRFLKWADDDVPDDKGMAQLTEMFPDETAADLSKFLLRAKNDVDTAIELVLARQTLSAPAIGAATARGGAGSNAAEPSRMDRAATDEPITKDFMTLCKFQVDARVVPDEWRTLEGRVTRGVSKTLEGNLMKILSAREHPMGKKVAMFSMAFNTSYSTPVSGVQAALQSKAALAELSGFFTQMRESVAGKVSELNTTAGALMIWRAVETCTLADCYDAVFELLRARNLDRDAALPFELIRATPVHAFVDAAAMTVGISGVAARSAPARIINDADIQPVADALAAFSSLRSVNQKLQVLVEAVHMLDDLVRQKNNGMGASASAIFPLMVVAVAKAHIQSPHAEAMLMRELIPTSISSGQEGFALAAFSAAAEWAVKICGQLGGGAAASSQQAVAAGPTHPKKHEVLPNLQDLSLAQADDDNDALPTYDDHAAASMYPPATNPTLGYNPAADTGSELISPSNPFYTQERAPENSVSSTQLRAQASFIETLHLMTDSIDAQNQLAEHYAAQGDLAQARQFTQNALALDPRDPTALQNRERW